MAAEAPSRVRLRHVAAGFCANTGIVLMGMNLAIASGKCADDTAIHACQQGDFSAATLAHYRTLLDHQYGHAETALE